MEEILASIRRIIEDNDADRPAPPRETPKAEIAPPLDVEHGEDEIASFRAELGEMRPRGATPTVPRAEFPAAFDPKPVAPRVEPPVFQARPEPPALQTSPAPDYAPVRPGHDILSASPGRKVAAAFDELSEAFAAQRRRSFDEIAEEMLKPMLREWLDDNLPTMVERLVREEIERLARGERG